MRRRRHSPKPAPAAAAANLPRVMRKCGLRLLSAAGVVVILALGLTLFGPHFGADVVHVDLQAAQESPAPPANAPASAASPNTPVSPSTEPAAATPEPGKKARKAEKTAKAEKPEKTDEEAKAKEEKKAEKAELKEDRKLEDEYFDQQDIVPYFKFDFIPEEWDYIHKDPRRYAECTMMDGDDPKLWKGVAVKLKGSAGSFQGPDAKPGLSVSMAKFQKAERWHGFLKWHLNNGTQDNSYLNEQMSCEIARKAGVPASRCAHALVKWQGRDLGLFVFKEAFDRDFLAKFYTNTNGDLYDGGFVSEIHVGMEKDQGDRLRQENVQELIAACQEGDPKKRWERLEKILDVDEYISFTAVESLVCHWDGYNFNRNNYRLYFDADTGKGQFWIHGTDQTFGDANFPVTRDPGSLVGQAVMSNPVWKQAYRDRVQKIYNEILKPYDWPGHVVEVGEKFKAAIALHDPRTAADYENRIKEARDRMESRIAGIAKQLGDVPNAPKFGENGVLKLTSEGWSQQGAAAAIDNIGVDGKTCLHIRADGVSTGSWRRTVALTPGRYRIAGRLRTIGVVPTQTPSGEGAGFRISGGTRVGLNSAAGDTPWKEAAFEFDAPGGDVVLVAELRATKGEVWFDRDSFRIEQVK